MAELRLMTRAPASTLSIMASASSSGVALGICPLPLAVSAKIGRNSSVQPGHIAGATEPRRAESMPATNVPCVHATLSARLHAPFGFPGISRMIEPARSGWSSATGPSIKATVILGAALAAFHQVGESDQLDRTHRPPRIDRFLRWLLYLTPGRQPSIINGTKSIDICVS